MTASKKLPQHEQLLSTAACLKLNAVQLDMRAAFEDSLLELFRALPAPSDRKSHRHFCRTLLRSGSYEILTVIWRLSKFVSEDEIERSRLGRSYDLETMTVHGLAVMFSEKPIQVATLNSRISEIVKAGSYCGLVERQNITSKMIEIRPTFALDCLMRRAADSSLQAIQQFIDWQAQQPPGFREILKESHQ